MKLWIEKHRMNDYKQCFPLFTGSKKPLVPWKVHPPGPAAESAIKHQVNCASHDQRSRGNTGMKWVVGEKDQTSWPNHHQVKPVETTTINSQGKMNLWLPRVSHKYIMDIYHITRICPQSLLEEAFSAPCILYHWINWRELSFLSSAKA